jgi:nitroreductase
MELVQVMRTTPATRVFTQEDLPDDVLYDILEAARFAPNGGNRQAWKVVIVRDPGVKQEVARLYDLGMREYAAQVRAGLVPFVASEAHLDRGPPVDLEEARRTPLDAEQSQIAAAPVLVVILLNLTNCSAVDSGLGRLSISAGASVYPFAHNILLAARDRGYGGHFTSVLARQEAALKQLLHVPDHMALATVLPLGRPPREITRLRRQTVEEFTTVGTFDGRPFRRAGA